jgi:hypothetical protein
MSVFRLGNSKRRSVTITKEIFDLRTSMKVIEEGAIGLEAIMEQMEALDREKHVPLKGNNRLKRLFNYIW